MGEATGISVASALFRTILKKNQKKKNEKKFSFSSLVAAV